jgi:3-keto-5-aminohexanoate cleavage enzyme
MDPLIITVAPVGAELTPQDTPHLAVTPAALGDVARRCRDAGASIIHVHCRNDDGTNTHDVERFRAAYDAIRTASDLIVQFSTGGAIGMTPQERAAPLALRPEMATLTCGTVNFGDDVFMNPLPFIRELYKRSQERRVVPEFELFDLGHVATLHRLLDELGEPHGGHVHCDLVMGVPGGMSGDAATLVRAVEALPPGATWSATGIGRSALPVMFAALSAGGHLRVGMEDTTSYAKGRPVTGNAELVARAAELAGLSQRPPMRPQAARAFLGVSDLN